MSSATDTCLIALAALTLFGCDANAAPPAEAHAEQAESADPTAEPQRPEAPKPVAADSLRERYTWINSGDGELEVIPLDRRFAAPEGFERIELSSDSFGAFLRGLPTRTDRTTVRSHAKKRLSSPSAAVVLMDVGERNLQQCADTIIRLHAEYLWSRGEADKLGYHFTSGDETRWADWQRGERYKIAGSTVERIERSAVANTRAQFRRWLDTVFMYAGTRSLRFDSGKATGAVSPGDFFVDPGSPGHAVIVLDVAQNAAGERVALLGQGFMPAQELHVLRGRGSDVRDGVWFVLPGEGETLDTPSWRPFARGQARRFGE